MGSMVSASGSGNRDLLSLTGARLVGIDRHRPVGTDGHWLAMIYDPSQVHCK
uniref:Uncharacterized protein n=1 Tax=Picea sitchensis TaxID=3332 RepID=A0A6B9XRC0_PICSI|nr:hypothetical protein Q903MT_gene5726 [Picea sitchensis]